MKPVIYLRAASLLTLLHAVDRPEQACELVDEAVRTARSARLSCLARVASDAQVSPRS